MVRKNILKLVNKQVKAYLTRVTILSEVGKEWASPDFPTHYLELIILLDNKTATCTSPFGI